jgi:lipopolysaccharide export system permease protein
MAVQSLMGIGVAFGAIACLIFLFDFAELTRRAGNSADLSMATLARMTLLRLPNLSERVLPLSVLFGTMWTFLQLTRHHELVVARAGGISVWQFLAPVLMISFVIGVFFVAIYNPISSAFMSAYERWEAQAIRGQTSLLAVSSSGFWLREGNRNGHTVIHALRVSDGGQELADVTFFFFNRAGAFTHRVDAEQAILRTNFWEARNALTASSEQPPAPSPQLRIPTNLTLTQIQDSFASPDTISFWNLPGFIRIAEEAGMTAIKHRLHWHAILSTPFLLCAMTLVAASFSLRLSRLGHIGQLVLGALFTGFLLYFVTDLSQTLGKSGAVPVMLAAWAPGAIAASLGLAALLHFEDG